MRTAVAIFLLVLFTITQTPVGQLLKLPLLIEHFYKHQKREGISVATFLRDHYSKKHNDADRLEDAQLPFKTVVLQTIGVAIVPTITEADALLCFDIPTKMMFNVVYTPQQHLSSIFHPPRV